jgi:hypothetical protein
VGWNGENTNGLTWDELATQQADFVDWARVNCGPLPDGPIVVEDWRRYIDAYVRRPDRTRPSWQSRE